MKFDVVKDIYGKLTVLSRSKDVPVNCKCQLYETAMPRWRAGKGRAGPGRLPPTD